MKRKGIFLPQINPSKCYTCIRYQGSAVIISSSCRGHDHGEVLLRTRNKKQREAGVEQGGDEGGCVSKDREMKHGQRKCGYPDIFGPIRISTTSSNASPHREVSKSSTQKHGFTTSKARKLHYLSNANSPPIKLLFFFGAVKRAVPIAGPEITDNMASF